MAPSPTLDDEVSFLSGVADNGTLQPTSFASWNGDNPATYTGGFTNAYKWGADTAGTPGGTIDYYFNPASNWTPTEEQVFIAGLALWSDIANITFVQTTNAAQAQLTFTRGSDGSADTQPNYTRTGTEGQTGGTQLDPLQSATVSIDTSVAGFGPIDGNFQDYGGYVYDTVVHEEGHVMGLGHAGPYNGSVNSATQQFSPYDTRLYSIMSYISPTDTSAKYYSQSPVNNVGWGVNAQGYARVPTTWMQADILAVQRLYGLPTSTPLSGGQTFGFNSNVAGPSGIFFDFTKNTSPVITIWDEGTGNTLDLSGFSTASNINLNAGTFSSCDAMTNNICIAQGTAIDDLVEGNGANTVLANNDGDIIVGGSGNDTITGGSGNDTITGGLGNNTIDGGGGINTFRVLGNSANYTITHNVSGSVTIQGPGETDLLTNVQYVAFFDKMVNLTATVTDYPDGSTDSSGIVLTDNTTQLQVLTGTATQSGVISESGGSFSFAKIGAGTLILTASETNTGGTTITAGTLQVGSGTTTGALGSGAITDNASLVFDRSDGLSLANAINGTGQVTFENTGVYTLTGNNSYAGTTTISSGATLQIGNGSTTGSLGTGAVVDNSQLTLNCSDPTTVANAISGTGHVTFTNLGGITLTGNNTYTGGTTIYEGAIAVGNGGTSGSITGDVVAGVATSNSGIVFYRTDNITFGGNISGLGYVDQYGSGTLTLTGTNTYGGVTTIIDSGTIAIASNGNLGAGVVQLWQGTLQFNGAFASGSNFTVGSGTFNTNGNNVVLNGSISNENGVSSASLTKTGAGTLTLAGTDTFVGSTVISAGVLQVGNGGTTGSLGSGAVTDNSVLAFDLSGGISLSSGISGSGELEQDGSGILTITVAQAYTGATGVNTGATLALSGAGSIASSFGLADLGTFDISQTSGVSVQALSGSGVVALGGQTLTVTGGNYVFSGVIQDGGVAGGVGGGLTVSGGELFLTGINTYSGATTIASGAMLVVGNNTATGSLGGGAVTDNGILAYALTGATTLATAISGSGELDEDGTGALTITVAQSYTGLTGINAGSTLALSGAGSIASSRDLVDLGGTFDISAATSGASVGPYPISALSPWVARRSP